MGHFTEIRDIAADRVAAGSSTSQIVSIAVNDWYNDHDSDRGDERSGYGVKTALMAPEAVNGYLNDNHDKVIENSLVIPCLPPRRREDDRQEGQDDHSRQAHRRRTERHPRLHLQGACSQAVR